MKMQKLAVGVDIGGTKIRGVVLSGRGKMVRREEYIYSHKPPTKKEFLDGLFGVIDRLLAGTPRKQIAGIGMGAPGVVRNGRSYNVTNLPASTFDFLGATKKRYGLPVALRNDVKAAALAEARLGAGRGKGLIFMVTLGTGVGGALVRNGHIVSGAFDSAYEVNMMVIDLARYKKGMHKGDFEAYSSAKFFRARGTRSIEAENRARSGDRKMKALWSQFGEYLGVSLANIVNIIEPETVIVGGGIVHAWSLFAPTTRRVVKQLTISPFAKQKTLVVPAKLGKDAGAIGGALLIFDQVR